MRRLLRRGSPGVPGSALAHMHAKFNPWLVCQRRQVDSLGAERGAIPERVVDPADFRFWRRFASFLAFLSSSLRRFSNL